jgi:inosine-uridine nucleoside N-ribohydrolase
MEKVKVLLDTDIGSDIDDAVCLAYLLANPHCELVGITTVTGEAVKRAMMAKVLCDVAGKQVPIMPGAETPLLVPQQQAAAPQAEALQRWRPVGDFPRGQAVEFMRQTIRTYPREVVLLAIGPLTNVALLFRVDPEIPLHLRALVMMGGRFLAQDEGGYDPPEWNVSGDPHATAIVYGTQVPLHRSVGLDVSTKVTMSAEKFRQKCGELELFRTVLDFAEIWFRQWDGITFHDPLAAATIFDNRICTFEKGTVLVEVSDTPPGCRTHWQHREGQGRHEVAVAVDVPRFFAHFFSVF